MDEVITFADLLKALQGPGAVALFLWASAWGLEELAFWQKLPPKAKSLIVLLAASAVGLFAVWFGTHPEWVAAADIYIKAEIGICGAWLTTQVVHRNDGKVKALRFERNLQEWDEPAPGDQPAG